MKNYKVIQEASYIKPKELNRYFELDSFYSAIKGSINWYTPEFDFSSAFMIDVAFNANTGSKQTIPCYHKAARLTFGKLRLDNMSEDFDDYSWNELTNHIPNYGVELSKIIKPLIIESMKTSILGTFSSVSEYHKMLTIFSHVMYSNKNIDYALGSFSGVYQYSVDFLNKINSIQEFVDYNTYITSNTNTYRCDIISNLLQQTKTISIKNKNSYIHMYFTDLAKMHAKEHGITDESVIMLNVLQLHHALIPHNTQYKDIYV